MTKSTVAKKQLASTKDYAAFEFDAAITSKEEDEMERVSQDCAAGRRIGFAVLTRTKAQLVESGDGETLGEMVDHLSDYITHLKAQIKLIQTAQVRLMSALATLVVQAEKKGARHRRGHSR